MKNYLKKLGRTKFQALLGALFVNGVTAYCFITGIIDIDSVVDKYMPIANMILGTFATVIYIWVEGSIDKASVGNGKEQSNDFETPIEPRL